MPKINRVHVTVKVIQSHNHSLVMHITAICRWTWPVTWTMR